MCVRACVRACSRMLVYVCICACVCASAFACGLLGGCGCMHADMFQCHDNPIYDTMIDIVMR